MKHLLLNLYLMLSIINAGTSIRCYYCEGREGVCSKASLELNQERFLHVCQGETDRCMRVWQEVDKYESIVQLSCSNERLCDKLEKACKKLKGEGYKCSVGCCHDDACNVANSRKNLSLYLFIVCIVFGLIQSINFT